LHECSYANILTYAYIRAWHRGWVGCREAQWRRRIHQLKDDENFGLGFLRQKYVADVMMKQELAVLDKYTSLERSMAQTKARIEALERTGASSRLHVLMFHMHVCVPVLMNSCFQVCKLHADMVSHLSCMHASIYFRVQECRPLFKQKS
jgi:hypothetical protein